MRTPNRLLLEDIYTAQIAACSGVREIAPCHGEVFAFTLGGDKQYSKLQQFSNAKIGRETIAKRKFLMTVRPSMKKYLETLSKFVFFNRGTLFYALFLITLPERIKQCSPVKENKLGKRF